MLSNEHLKLLLQAVAVVLALHFAKGHMTGEYRNLMAVGLVAVVLVVVNHLFAEYEGMNLFDKAECVRKANEDQISCFEKVGLTKEKMEECGAAKDPVKCVGGDTNMKALEECGDKFYNAWTKC